MKNEKLEPKIKKLPKLIVILGPTASGKSALAIKLAGKFNGEVVSADSRQIYKEMDIGTGKVTPDTKNPSNFSTGQAKKKYIFTHKGIPHYCIDVASPKRRFSVAQYQKLALGAINKILKKGKVPFLVGGSPFYIYSVVEGWVFPKLKADQKLRKRLEKKSVKELFNILKKLDPRRAAQIEKKNKRRLIRAIEVAKKLGGVPTLKKNPQFDCLLLGIKRPQEELEESIKKRFLKWLKRGFVKEVKNLKKSGLSWKRIEDFGLHYRVMAQYLQKKTLRQAQGKLSYEEMIKNSVKKLQNYVKYQMSWFKRDKRIKWVKNYQEAEKLIKEFLK